ncbi:melatonin receptor type 1A-like [Asterias rubens]|uniref:melatonin receptor type 1A-like n=1 Tax=Asterias rubens TaxID=7604 RepID=UPI001455D1CF|nr:melatonin receptor type 1A-like [Asterias rubens]
MDEFITERVLTTPPGNGTVDPGVSTETSALDTPGHHTVRAVLISFFVLSMAWGNVGNPFVMATILTQRKIRQNVANVFIFNLAIADFCVTSFVDLSYVLGNIQPRWLKESDLFCGFSASICIISCTCSLWSITAISVNRYVCVTKGVIYHKIYTRRNTLLMAAFLWILCFLIDFPNLVGLGKHIFDVKKRGCSFDRLGYYGYTLYFIGMGVATPMSIVVFCYLKIFLFVRAHHIKIQAWKSGAPSDGHSPIDGGKKIDTRLLRTVAIIFIVFLLCWTPYTIIVLSDLHNTYPDELYVAAIIMAHANSSMNSILYGVTNKNFRDGYRKLIQTMTCGRACASRADRQVTNPSSTVQRTTRVERR